jgi:hypothetical protein
MKPLNLDNKPCSPISSNCVVWQGPDIPCINLCTGDSVSDVVSAMGTELCTILDTLNVSNYDLTCFNLQACGPEDFQALIQFLITQICELQGVTTPTTKEGGCPDCVVSVAECFVTGTQTTMQLVDYVQFIGERVCSIITEISLINAQITDILIRVTDLENAPVPTFTLPSFTLGCTIGSLNGVQAIDTVLIEFINNVWCPFYAETGTTAELDAAGKQKCLGDADTQLNTGTAFSTNPNWILDANYDTLADAINNIWVALCDVWNYNNTNPSVTVADTNTIDLELSVGNELTAKVQDTGWQPLVGFNYQTGTIGPPECRRIGNTIHFRGLIYVPLGDGGNRPIDASSVSSYSSTYTTSIATSGFGVDGACALFGNSSLKFNLGASVIPTTVLDVAENLDGPYRLNFPTVALRVLNVTALPAPVDSFLLSAACRVGINEDKSLYVGSLHDAEEGAGNSAGLVGNSALRYITSNVRTGESIPLFNAATSDISSFPTSGVQNIETNVDTQIYPITCDAGDITQLGGFYFTIEGLTAHVACSSNIPSASCY